MIEIMRILLYVSLGIPSLIFGLYGITILYYGRLKRTKVGTTNASSSSARSEPTVSVVIATHNEEMIISKKIENLLSCNYPKEKIEMIFVDDSSDCTPEIIKTYSSRFNNIHLIEFNERIGYSPSMIAGCKEASGEIIVLNDAGSFLDTQAIVNIMTDFQDPNIGVVTGKDVILNESESIGKSENLYQRLFNLLRIAETNMDSTFYIKGEATGVRRDLIKDLDKCGETFDTTVGLFVRQKGYRVIYDPNVKFYEYAPSTHSGRIKQKTIRGANLVKVLWRFKGIMFKGRYGKYGLMILPINFGMLAVAPIAILIGLMLLASLALFDLTLFAIVWSGLGCTFLFLFIFSRNLLFTFLEFEYSLLKALYQVIFTRKSHDKIDKVASTRRFEKFAA
jgi:cellulose synthase/poly-beta-1,6-N-acetylglucosamine synthase-like glycosyltransferase